MKTIRDLRRERGWTQFELALAVGVQPQTVYLWESGRRMPQVPQVRKLGEIFAICSDEIALEPRGSQTVPPPQRAPTGRRLGETVPGRGPDGRAVSRGQSVPALDRDAL